MKTYFLKIVIALFICASNIPIYSTGNISEISETSGTEQTTYLCINNTRRMLYYYPRNKNIEERILHAAPGTCFTIHTANTKQIFLSIHPIKHKTSLESVSIPKNCNPNALGQIKLTINLDQHHDIFATAS